MVLSSLEDISFAQMVANSHLTTLIPSRLENLFNAIPAHVDPTEIDGVDVTWGLDSPAWTKEKNFLVAGRLLHFSCGLIIVIN
uniref:Uncharacterized protein n=1 Tax=Apis cerana TaxID=7461 RepID=V9ILE0_APICE